jgi:hypothetical protein
METTTSNETNRAKYGEDTTSELVEMFASVTRELENVQRFRDELRAELIARMNDENVDTFETYTATVTRTRATVRAFDVATLRELVAPSTFDALTRISVEPKAFDKATKNGDIHDDIVSRVVSVARVDERVTVRENTFDAIADVL